MELKERIRRTLSNFQRKILGPSPLDRDYPDTRPENSARDRMQAAQITSKINSKESALRQIEDSQSSGLSDYVFRKNMHSIAVSMAIKKAREYGANEEEIRMAVIDGNLLGDTMRQGYDDYWR